MNVSSRLGDGSHAIMLSNETRHDTTIPYWSSLGMYKMPELILRIKICIRTTFFNFLIFVESIFVIVFGLSTWVNNCIIHYLCRSKYYSINHSYKI